MKTLSKTIAFLASKFTQLSFFFPLLLLPQGLAGFANFKSAARGNEPNSFLLEWTSESQTPIEEFELTWRQEDGQWEGFTVDAYKVNEINWAGKHAFTGLSSATRFEVKVSAKNQEGWSRLSPSFHFATFGAGKYT